jgi:hypothetical protein
VQPRGLRLNSEGLIEHRSNLVRQRLVLLVFATAHQKQLSIDL